MSGLAGSKPLQYVQLSVNGKHCGRPVRVLWNIRPGPVRGPDSPHGWCVTEPCPEKVTLRFLANLLRVKPFRVVADLLDLRILANADEAVSFETALEILRHHGYTVHEA